MSVKRKKYTQEFKEEAVALAESLGNTSEAARQLGISHVLLQSWKKRLKEIKPLTDAEKEIKKLREENAKLKKVKLLRLEPFLGEIHLSKPDLLACRF